MSNLIRIMATLQSTPWAIEDSYLQTMVQIAMRENQSVEAVAAQLGRPLENTHEVTVRDGVATIPVTGPLFRRANLFTAISGATSYDVLATDFNEALADPSVASIVLNIDSPGGDANGCSELAEMIYAARGAKPVVAYVGGSGTSAAYWIASAADRIVVADTGILGSIGVVSTTRKKSDDGTIEIVSAQSPYKRIDVGTDEGRSRIQAVADKLAQVFVETVARNRSTSVDTVLSDFGQGGLLIGTDAVAAGMADSIGTYEGLHAQLIAARQQNTGSGFAAHETPVAGHQPSREVNTMDIATLRAEHGDLVAAIEAEAKASVQVPDVAAAETAAATAERDRVLGILASDAAQGRSKLAMTLAKRPGMSAEDAAEILAAAPEEAKADSGNAFDQHMAGQNPAVQPDPEAGDGDEGKAALERSVALGKQLGIE